MASKTQTRDGIWVAESLKRYMECPNCLLLPTRGLAKPPSPTCHIVRCKKHYQEDMRSEKGNV